MAVVAMAGLLSGVAFAGPDPEKIEFSGPKGSGAISNLNRLGPGEARFNRMQEDLSRPFESLSKGSSMDGVMVAPFQPSAAQPALNRRDKQLMEQRKNWAFTDLNDLTSQPSLEEMFNVREYGPDGREKKSLSPIEKYYEGHGYNQNALTAKEMNEGMGAAMGYGLSSSNGLNPMGLPFPGSDRLMKNIFTPENADQADKSAASLTRYGGFANPALFPSDAEREAARIQKENLQRFKELLDPPRSSAATARSFNPAGVLGGADRQAGAGGYNPLVPQLPAQGNGSALSPVLGAVSPATVFRPAVLRDPTRAALGLEDLVPKVEEAPKAATFNFELPKRKF